MNNRLYRSPDDRVLAGVAGGLAEAYDLDPALVRIVWALLIVFTGGAFLIIYIVMALVVPLRPMSWTPAPQTSMAPPPVGSTDPATTTVGTPPTDPAGAPSPAAPSPPLTPWAYQYRRRGQGSGAWILGVLLIVGGAYLLLREFYPVFDIGRFWPLIFIFLGAALIITAFGRRTA